MWVGLEGILLSEIRQRKTNTVWFHLYVESKQTNKNRVVDIETEGMATRREGVKRQIKLGRRI